MPIIHVTREAFDEEPMWCPVVFCDQCRGAITEMGNVIWFRHTKRNRTTAPVFAHKGHCDDLLIAGLSRKFPEPAWFELVEDIEEWLPQTLANFKDPGLQHLVEGERVRLTFPEGYIAPVEVGAYLRVEE